MSDIHMGDVGTTFILTVMDGTAIVDISAASVMKINLVSPTTVKTTHTATHTTDGTDGKMEYATTAANVLSMIGAWQWQGQITLPGGSWKTNVLAFTVLDNL